jgi:hypothetical protein
MASGNFKVTVLKPANRMRLMHASNGKVIAKISPALGFFGRILRY